MGYEIYWPVPQNYCPLFRNINYVTPVGLPFDELNIVKQIYQMQHENTFDKVIDLSFGFGGMIDDWWKNNGSQYDSFVTAKYQLAHVPVEQRRDLHWARNTENEQALYDQVICSDKYILVQNTTHLGTLFDITDKREIVYFKPQGNFNIFDWYTVILGAEEIHCLDSSLSNYIETIDAAKSITKYIYLSKKNIGEEYLNASYRNNWIEV